MVILLLLLAGTASGSSEQCKACHSDIYESWAETDHATTVGDESLGLSCENCHSTTYSDGTTANGVQCERCHEVGPDHLATGAVTEGMIDWSADLCGDCHSGGHAGQYDGWKLSGHARSLEITDPKCRSCHVGQSATMELFNGKTKMPPVDNPQPIDCQTCHDPHGSANQNDLRAPLDEICEKCHTTKDVKLRGEVEHPQAAMYEGSIMDQYGVKCYDCHAYTNRTGYEPKLLGGHTFKPAMASCIDPNCHPDKDIEWSERSVEVAQDAIRDKIEETAALVNAVDAAISNAYPSWDGTAESIATEDANINTAVEKFIEARDKLAFVEGDGSLGFHNRIKAQKMLEEAQELAHESIVLLREEIEVPPVPGEEAETPGFGLVSLLVGFAAVYLLMRKE
ncbi:MAG: cytochrome C [Candidatus Syntrophoarchaeum caldarius]|uniref:Cytochrome C n=1 Tax=Candidatus Syntropharchaeum caldarium TaxID=1838285 RepID=A0A1F2P9J7_9EURY|nr:MAG: cytochrome C [Candidatus Syntrophoarchaeum caldarius]